ncbi:pyruvate ferredoxin oxidoreductase [Candidatus Falkowbacteria bacterium]|nr:pyruvate ferredoxin oxidoreductase [Candidatus Falkowbacteria bacterium]NCT54971.1 pyruvate ferredoxin oxidoreductase [Candidatus Falkowbacteria bacterium]
MIKNKITKKADQGKREILEGSRAVALMIKNIKPNVISAYPITPQTHIVEDLAKMKANGEADYEYLRAESEFAAASIVLGASAAGARVYSATSSQGLLLMAEVVHNIAGMRLPVVMTCANRAISAPISIWNDHSDVMNIKDSGFIQFFASDSQEAVNQHLLAYKIAEKQGLPVMVNMDGFILTHSYEPVIIPTRAKVKKFLPDYKPAKGTYLDPKNPKTFGAFFPPAYYMETRENLHQDLIKSLELIKKEYAFMIKTLGFNNKDNGLVEYLGPKNPKIILVALGSLNGTILETITSDKKLKTSVGLLKIKTYRPFPAQEIIKVIKAKTHVAVLEKAISLGQAGPLYNDVVEALSGQKNRSALIKNYIVGLGGRDISSEIIKKIIIDSPKKNASLKFYG